MRTIPERTSFGAPSPLCYKARPSFVLVLLIALFAYTPLPVLATGVPWHAEDYHTILSNYPDILEYVNDNAEVFVESINNIGDYSQLSNPSRLFYLNVLSVRIRGWAHGLDEMMRQYEDAFYHGSDAACAIAFYDDQGHVELHWEWDYRFADVANFGSSGQVDNYRVSRAASPEGPFTDVIGDDLTATQAVDSVPLATNYYLIESKNQSGQYIAYSHVIPVTGYVVDAPQFWLKNKQYIDSDISNLHSSGLFQFNIEFGATEIVNAADLTLEVAKTYTSELYIIEPDSTLSIDVSVDPVDGTVSCQFSMGKSELRNRGGLSYRLRYFPSGGPAYYFPAEGTAAKKFFTAALNNRVVTAKGPNYLVRPASASWRNSYCALVQDYVDGTSESFDGIFADDCEDRFPSNRLNKVMPYEYFEVENSDVEFLQSMMTFLGQIKSAISYEPLFINGLSAYLLWDFRGQDVIDGIMIDGWTDHEFKDKLPETLWAVRNFAESHVIVREAYPVDNINDDESRDQYNTHRIQSLASWMIIRNDPDNGENTNSLLCHRGSAEREMITIVPELQIDFGNSVIHPFNEYQWPDSAGGVVSLPLSQLPDEGRFWCTRQFMIGGDPTDVTFVYRVYQNGFAIVDTWHDSPSQEGTLQATLADMLCLPDTIPSTVFELKLEGEEYDLFDGARFSTGKSIKLYEDPVEMSQGEAKVFVYHQISSPKVAEVAWDPIYCWQSGEPSKIAVEASGWNPHRLAELVVDASAIGGYTEEYLVDDGTLGDKEADDGIYSSRAFVSSAGEGDYWLKYRAVDEDGYRTYDKFLVHVIIPPKYAYVNKSDYTGDLTTMQGEPYSNVAFDYNSDGKGDLFISLKDENATLYRNDGASNGVPIFTNRTQAAFGIDNPPEENARGVSSANFDNDNNNTLDLFVAHYSDPHFYMNDGAGGFIDSTAGWVAYESDIECSFVGAVCDYDKDGDLDIFIGTDDYEYDDPSPYYPHRGRKLNTFLRNTRKEDPNAAYLFEKANAEVNVDDISGTFTAVWGDVNNDGWQDLFVGELWTGIGGEEVVPHLHIANDQMCTDGDCEFEDGDSWFPNGTPERVVAAAFFDYDQDQDLDLIIGSIGRDDNLQIYENTGGSFLEIDKAVLGLGEVHEDVNGLAILDADGNGLADIMVLPYAPLGGVRLFANLPIGGVDRYVDISDAVNISDGKTNGISYGDFDGDGRIDLYLGRNSDNGEFYFKNTPYQSGTDYWMAVELEGGGGNNYDGIGAKVSIIAGGATQAKIKDGGYGRGSMGERNLHFALGDCQQDSVTATVTWPSGHEQVVQCAVNELTDIQDNTVPGIQVGTIQSHYFPGPEGTEWQFEWITSNYTDLRLDKVEVLSSYDPADPCYCGGNVTLAWGDAGVSVQAERQETGGVKHVLTWSEGCCYPRCSYQYRVTSATRFYSETSSYHNFAPMKTCISP